MTGSSERAKQRDALVESALHVARGLVSPNEMDRNGESANLVDGLFAIARAISDLAEAVREVGDPK